MIVGWVIPARRTDLQGKEGGQMIKLILLTGFLGAGKTTLLKELLSSYGDAKVGVVINEFGEINVDARLIRREGIQMAELTNGSIFCACIKDKFVQSLIEMTGYDLDYVFIEASGLADPANMTRILGGIKEKVQNEYDYRGSVCVVDGENFLELYELLPAISAQLEFCGSVIVNKADRIEECRLQETLCKIKNLNPRAAVTVTSYCRVNVRELVEGISENNAAARESSNRAETRPVTFVLKGMKTVPYERLPAFLAEIADSAYRIKGFVNTELGCREISAVGRDIEINDWHGSPAETELVVISAVGFKVMSILTQAIEKHGLKGILRV